MPQIFKFHATQWTSGGFHVVILIIAAQADSAAVWPWALGAMALVSFFAWMANYRRYRQIHDLPTSKVASAAQGYVELFGQAGLIDGSSLVSTRTGLSCCWIRYYVERRNSEDKWVYEDSGESTDHFLLIDETGQCVVSPEGAEVISGRKEIWTQGDYRRTEWLLLPKGPLYALGEFVTLSGTMTERDERTDVGELLTEWKKDKTALLKRFDSNHDGEIDMKEWERARLEARKEVRRRNAEGRAAMTDGVSLLRKPADGRIFVLADELPARLGRHYARWSAAHLAILFAAGGAALLMLL